MARTPKLTDIQLVLLTTAAQRAGGHLLPPTQTIAGQADRISKAVTQLVKRGLAEEVPAADPAQTWRSDGERHVGAVISAAGRTAIGVENPEPEEVPTPAQTEVAPGEVDVVPATGTKQALIISLLQRDAGATLTELTAATGWLPHTTRAALTGLRKKGHQLDKSKRDDVTCYRIAAAA